MLPLALAARGTESSRSSSASIAANTTAAGKASLSIATAVPEWPVLPATNSESKGERSAVAGANNVATGNSHGNIPVVPRFIVLPARSTGLESGGSAATEAWSVGAKTASFSKVPTVSPLTLSSTSAGANHGSAESQAQPVILKNEAKLELGELADELVTLHSGIASLSDAIHIQASKGCHVPASFKAALEVLQHGQDALQQSWMKEVSS